MSLTKAMQNIISNLQKVINFFKSQSKTKGLTFFVFLNLRFLF